MIYRPPRGLLRSTQKAKKISPSGNNPDDSATSSLPKGRLFPTVVATQPLRPRQRRLSSAVATRRENIPPPWAVARKRTSGARRLCLTRPITSSTGMPATNKESANRNDREPRRPVIFSSSAPPPRVFNDRLEQNYLSPKMGAQATSFL